MVAQTAASSASIPNNTQVFDVATNEPVTVSGTTLVTATTQTTANGVQLQLGSQTQGSGTGSTSGNTYQLGGSDSLTATVPSLPANVNLLSKASLTGANGQSQNVVVILQVSVDTQGNPTATVQAVQTSSM
jgi:hypothetical protein